MNAEILQTSDSVGYFSAVSKTFKCVLNSHCLKTRSESLFQLNNSVGISLKCSTFHVLDRCCKLHIQKSNTFNWLNFEYVCTPPAVSNTGQVELTEWLTVHVSLFFVLY